MNNLIFADLAAFCAETITPYARSMWRASKKIRLASGRPSSLTIRSSTSIANQVREHFSVLAFLGLNFGTHLQWNCRLNAALIGYKF